jgi:hypothetical protein
MYKISIFLYKLFRITDGDATANIFLIKQLQYSKTTATALAKIKTSYSTFHCSKQYST